MAKNIKLGTIHIASWEPSDLNQVVLKPNTQYELIIDYPTSYPYHKKFNTDKNGMTKLKLIDFICKHYHKMYNQEDANKAKGKESRYGIYGHDISDLVLCSATINSKNIITLGVDS